MARKSSKTAHVMNLLAGDEPETSKTEAAKENQAASLNTDSSETIKELTVLAHKASIQTQEGPLTPSPISIIDMSSSSPDPVSEMIRQQLEDEEGIPEAATKMAEDEDEASENAFSDKATADEVATNESVTKEIIDDNAISDEALASDALNKETRSDEILTDEAINNNVINDEILADETINNNVINNEALVEEAINHDVPNNETLVDISTNNNVANDKPIVEEAISKNQAIQTEVENDLNLESNSEGKENTKRLNQLVGNSSDLDSTPEEMQESPVVLKAAEVNVIETNVKEPETNSAPETQTLDVQEKTSSPELEKPTFKYLNVMEYVVQNKVHEYAAKLDACCCGHCIADITALTLTNLPPKYVVVAPPTASPLLNFYVNRYSQQVFVELTKACFTVKQNPHH
jgi:hypothetical protein